MEHLWKRYAFLSALAEQPQSSRQLEEQLGVSRATVHRATKKLVEIGIVEEQGRTFTLTPLGNVALISAKQSWTALAVGADMEPILRNVDSELLLENIHRFEGSEILVRDNPEPLTIENRIVQSINQSDTMKRVTHWRVWTRDVLNTIVTNVEEGMSYELILPISEWDYLDEGFEDEVERLSSLDSLSVFVNDELPFSFYFLEDFVQIPAFDERGNIVALAECSNQEATDWTDFVFSGLKEEGRKVL